MNPGRGNVDQPVIRPIAISCNHPISQLANFFSFAGYILQKSRLTDEEKREVVANCDHLNRLKFSPGHPYAFTEHGAVMLASVLNSERAIKVNIQIVRIFTRMRKLLETHSEILRKLEQLEKNDVQQEKQILLIFEYLKQLEQAKQQEIKIKERKRIGFKPR